MDPSKARATLRLLALAAGATAVLAVGAARQATQAPVAVAAREDAYRANNIGVTRLEQFDFDAAAASFRRALELDPKLAIARLNLGIALFYGGNPDGAQPEIVAARASIPDRPQPDYVLGLIARGAGRAPEAIDAFVRVQKMDPDDVGTAINLGQLYRQERKFSGSGRRVPSSARWISRSMPRLLTASPTRSSLRVMPTKAKRRWRVPEVERERLRGDVFADVSRSRALRGGDRIDGCRGSARRSENAGDYVCGCDGDARWPPRQSRHR